MRKEVSEFAREINARRVVSVIYPMAHRGAIWQTKKGDMWLWEIAHTEEQGSVPIASGYCKTQSEAQDAMNGVMSAWVAYGAPYTADKATPPPAPPPPLGFRGSNSND